MRTPEEIAEELATSIALYVETYPADIIGKEHHRKDLITTASRWIQDAITQVRQESEAQRCDHCGAKAVSYRELGACPGCGAPICCPQCCKINNLEARIKELEKGIMESGGTLLINPKLWGACVENERISEARISALEAALQDMVKIDPSTLNDKLGAHWAIKRYCEIKNLLSPDSLAPKDGAV